MRKARNRGFLVARFGNSGCIWVHLSGSRAREAVVPHVTESQRDRLPRGRRLRKVLVLRPVPTYDERVATTDSAPLTLRRLEDHLWQAADLFRNKVSNQKDYILALLFFKRASDLYKEELEVAREELSDVPNAEELARDSAFHVLQVPDGHSWDDVRNTDEALQGQALNDALAAIGRANPKQLAGVF
jgi:hypothetical protein